MHPILFQLGPITLYSFGLLVALGFLLGGLWALNRAKAQGINPDDILELLFWLIVTGFVGARLLYVFYFPETYMVHPLNIITDRAGLVWYGGMLSAIVAIVLFQRRKKISLPQLTDILSAPAALGLAIGRIGCLMSGCCFGKACALPWAIHFPHSHQTYPLGVHPTQLYESLSLLLLIGLILWLEKSMPRPGRSAATLLMGYGVIRFTVECFRGDVVYWVGHLLTASQVFSLLAFAVGLVWMMSISRPSKP